MTCTLAPTGQIQTYSFVSIFSGVSYFPTLILFEICLYVQVYTYLLHVNVLFRSLLTIQINKKDIHVYMFTPLFYRKITFWKIAHVMRSNIARRIYSKNKIRMSKLNAVVALCIDFIDVKTKLIISIVLILLMSTQHFIDFIHVKTECRHRTVLIVLLLKLNDV